MFRDISKTYWHKYLAWVFCLSLFIIGSLPAKAQKKQKRETVADTVTVANHDTLGVDSLARFTTPPTLVKDSVKRHSPKKAAIFSAALPGLGQAYNKKYWKIPIIYAGFGGLGYSIYISAKHHNEFSAAYRLLVNDTSGLVGTVKIGGHDYNTSQALNYKNYYKRNLDISIIFTAVLYALNIVDATVDAHLFHFDISDKLTLHVQPVYQFQASGRGFAGVQLNFRL